MSWDFALILLFFATAVPLLGRRRIRQLMRMEKTSRRDRLTLYASTIVFQWAATAAVLWRTSVHRIPPVRLGIALPTPRLTALVSILLVALVLANQIISLRRLAQNPAHVPGILPHLATKVFPQSSFERVCFSLLVFTVSICEEVIYRGFAQRVFQDASGDLVTVGIIGSALLFAIAHLYQGRRGLVSTLVVGVLFSLIRAWTGSLLAPSIAHFAADLTAGFLAPGRFRALNSAVAAVPGANEPVSGAPY